MRRLAQLTLQVGLGTAISVICLLLVVRSVDLNQVTGLLSRATWPLLGGAIAATITDIVLRAFRWRVLVAPLKIVPVTRVLVYLLVGYLANNVLPGRAGELVRSHYLGDREGASRTSVLGTVLVERILDVLSLLFLSAMAWWLTGAVPQLAGLLAIGVVGGVVALALLVTMVVLPGSSRVLPWLGRQLPSIATSIGAKLRAGVAVAAHRKTLLVSLALTLGAWGATAAVFAVAAAMVGLDISPAQVLLIAAATNLATAIPSAPGYLGTFEFAVVATAGAIGLATAPALAVGVLVHAVVLLTTTVGGLAALALLGYSTRLRSRVSVVADEAEMRGRPRQHLPLG